VVLDCWRAAVGRNQMREVVAAMEETRLLAATIADRARRGFEAG